MKIIDFISKGIKLKKIDDNTYLSGDAPVKNKLFNLYRYIFNNDRTKLSTIAGFTEEIKTNKAGSQAIAKINEIKSILEKKYGEGFFIDVTNGDYRKNWNKALGNNDISKVYSYTWTDEKTLKQNNGIRLIVLYPKLTSKNNTLIVLDYYLDDYFVCGSAAFSNGKGL